MLKVKRSIYNPIITPQPDSVFESFAAFNWSPIRHDKAIHCFYRAMSEPETVNGNLLSISSIGHTSSSDGIHFEHRHSFLAPEKEWERYGCEDPRVTHFEGKYYIFYTALSLFPFRAEGIKAAVAISKDLKTVESRHLITPFNAKAMVLFPERVNGKMLLMLTADTDQPPSKIAFREIENENELFDEEGWKRWYSEINNHLFDARRAESDHVEIGAVPVKTDKGWVLIYSHIQNYFGNNPHSRKVFGIEALLLDLNDPRIIIGRTRGPLLIPENVYEIYGQVPDVIFPTGALIEGDKLDIYYGATDTTCCTATVSLSKLLDHMLEKEPQEVVKRFDKNPILLPIPEHDWESKAVFNPAAIDINGKVYILYRAMSSRDVSTVGLAVSKDGYTIDERLPEPIYVPREPFEIKDTPGNSGCEDPRISRIGDTLYMCYTAYDGVHPPAVALSSISVDDFTNNRWDKWSKPVLVTPEGIDDKDSAIVEGVFDKRYMILHRINHQVCADYIPSLDLNGSRISKGIVILSPRAGLWDGLKVGIASPPLKTDKGWILLYHGVSQKGYYSVGAALLDLKNPMHVISRTLHPILEPKLPFEEVGQIPHVVFPCGSVIRDGLIFIYYGGADSVVCVGTVKVDDLLEMLD